MTCKLCSEQSAEVFFILNMHFIVCLSGSIKRFRLMLWGKESFFDSIFFGLVKVGLVWNFVFYYQPECPVKVKTLQSLI
jgi:hypothetical protein